mmetsp:Transcript_4858/g.14118  ORF Transcript_4858/g.14118 Transcript_4858/m.14118 type:complete len:237 (-) Transcript_4858:81-791(-)
MSCLASCCCCCIKVSPKSSLNELMLIDTAADQQPSCLQRFCLCYCKPLERKSNGIEEIPQLRGLAGLTVQDGDHITAGSLQTLKYAPYDPEARVLYMPVYGGFGWWHGGTTGLWTEPANCVWGFLMTAARLSNYTYKFTFSEDYLHVDIDIMTNMFGVVGCACLPAWCTVPRCITHFTAEQDLGSADGTEWSRYNAACCGKPRFYYKLREVWQADGAPGRFHDRLSIVPQQVMLSY